MLPTTLLLLLGLLSPTPPATGWSDAEYAGSLTDPELDEVSGLAASRVHPGLYWAQNDSGNPANLMLIRADGTRVATYHVTGATNTDWEDIDAFELDGKHYLLVADTGDNGGIRETLSLLVIEEPKTIKDGDSLSPAWTIEFRWPDGARDCEASAVDAAKGEVLLISKKRVPPELFRLPLRQTAGIQIAQRIATLPGIAQPSEDELTKNPVYGRYRSQVSGADLSPNGRVLAVLNYHSVYFYVRQPGQDWPAAMTQPPEILHYPWLPQAEAIAFSVDGSSLLIGSEQRPTPLLRFHVKQ
ncbi:MAG TPA: hypothetical protein VKM35_09255 [Arenimonas sp.]|uniref:hypothetical protein n=1 Tax=Arenimonas sp. TaxID=1872635 RepID=UPI002D0EF97F|nr:hypothetical protein [Arenimonas sp.]HMB57382.1 hypothetical protein [Arenimonas sp.]